VQEVERMYGR